MTAIERLRALEKKWRETEPTYTDPIYYDDADRLTECADELATLIAELGQEVGSVADGMEFFAAPDDLHPETVNLVARFAAALAEKLAISQRKYGYSNGWASPGWMDECREKLAKHIAKGDPRDVAAYCAFLWHHGESTAMPTVEWTKDAEEYGSALNEAAWTFVGECPEKSALLFNNTKASLRAAILTYAQHVARATSPAHTSEARDAAGLVAAAKRLDKFSLVILSSVAVEDPEFSERVGAALVDLRNAAHADPCAVKYRKALERIFDCGRFPEGHHSAGDHEFCGSHHADCIAIAREALSEDAAMRQEAGSRE